MIVFCRAVYHRHLGTKVQARLVAATQDRKLIRVFDDAQFAATPEFHSQFPQALRRATVVFDPERTRNQWPCGCAFSIQMTVDGKPASLDQHHLTYDGLYYHLNWQSSDLSDLIEACTIDRQAD